MVSSLALEYPYGQMAKLRRVDKTYVGLLEVDINVIGFRVFPLSLTNDGVMWFSEHPYNSIHRIEWSRSMLHVHGVFEYC